MRLTPADLQHEIVPIDALKPFPGNARIHDDDLLDESIDEHGVFQAIVVSSDDYILSGNGTWARAKEAGEQAIVIGRLPINHDDPQARKINLVANRANDRAGYDDGLLVALLSSVPDLAGTGYGQEDLAALLAKAGPVEGLTDPDAVPEPPEEPVTRPGDLWLLGEHRLLCGDATATADVDRLMDGDLADISFTDPPYGIGYLPDTNARLKQLGKLENDHRQGRWAGFDEFTAFLDRSLEQLVHGLKPGACYYVCMGWEHLADVVASMKARDSQPYSVLVWDRMTPRLTSYPQDYIWCHEYMVYGWKRGANRKRPSAGPEQTTIWRFKTESAKDMQHTTQKPVALVSNALLNSSNPGDLVLDLFGGSGTTLIGAHQERRKAYLMEVDPKYCDVTCRRFQEFTGILPVLEASGEKHNFTA